jgi:hypothetical protein
MLGAKTLCHLPADKRFFLFFGVEREMKGHQSEVSLTFREMWQREVYSL